MSTTTISTSTGSVIIKPEGTYGSLGAGSLTPATDVFDANTISVAFDMAEVTGLEAETVERNEMRAVRSQNKPDVVGPYVAGSKVAVRRGNISLTLRLRSPGLASSDDQPFHVLLASMLADDGAPLTTSDSVLSYWDPAPGATAADANHFRPSDVSLFSEGDVITVDVDDRPHALYVTQVDNTPGEEYVAVLGAPRHLTMGDTVRLCRTFKNQAPGPSFAMRFDKDPDQPGGPGYRAECFGCRVVGVSWSVTPLGESAVVRAEFDIAVGHLRYDHANASVTAPAAGQGVELQGIGSTFGLTETLPPDGTGGPFLLAQLGDLYVGEATVGLTAVQQNVPDHRSVLAGELTVANVTAENGLRLSRPQTGFDADLAGGVERCLTMCFGSAGAGNAVAVVIPCAFSSADPGARNEQDENVVQQLTLGAEVPRGTATAASADSSFIIAAVH